MRILPYIACLGLMLWLPAKAPLAGMLTKELVGMPSVPAVIVTGASIGSGQWPVLRRRIGLLTPHSETSSIPGYFGLGSVLVERAQGALQVFTLARAATTSYDLPNGRYDAVGDGSVPFWPSLKNQFDQGFRYSQVPTGAGLASTATHLIITLPDDCYFAVDFAVPGCVTRMIANTERAVQAARAKGLSVIVELQNNLDDLNIEGVPGLITTEQYLALSAAWDNAFKNREQDKIFTINLYQAAHVDPAVDLLDGVNHLTHAAMVRAADQMLQLIYATAP
ncbi:hypothetical protein [Methyloterricola oryzae]|uniref:hypothetical protein n=1 Tax=Methyloterricola oryzae TaxID=1495050 RepID=UPI0005EBE8ED|nr:hypothetical protein [Methyloterricola oryzae]